MNRPTLVNVLSSPISLNLNPETASWIAQNLLMPPGAYDIRLGSPNTYGAHPQGFALTSAGLSACFFLGYRQQFESLLTSIALGGMIRAGGLRGYPNSGPYRFDQLMFDDYLISYRGYPMDPDPPLQTLAQIPSRSSPTTKYTVKRNPQTGAITCDCPGWIYSRREPRSCRHTLIFEQLMSDATIAPGTPIDLPTAERRLTPEEVTARAAQTPRPRETGRARVGARYIRRALILPGETAEVFLVANVWSRKGIRMVDLRSETGSLRSTYTEEELLGLFDLIPPGTTGSPVSKKTSKDPSGPIKRSSIRSITFEDSE